MATAAKVIRIQARNPSALARSRNGRKGGMALAVKVDHETRVKWGETAGGETLRRYGRDYFRHIRSLRTHYPKRLRRTR